MATMVKEKRKEKKKIKQKEFSNCKTQIESELPVVSCINVDNEKTNSLVSDIITEVPVATDELSCNVEVKEHNTCDVYAENEFIDSCKHENKVPSSKPEETCIDNDGSVNLDHTNKLFTTNKNSSIESETKLLSPISVNKTYKSISVRIAPSSETIEKLFASEACTLPIDKEVYSANVGNVNEVTEDILPSAPILETQEPIQKPSTEKQVKQEIPHKYPCMSLEEAIRLYGGKEIEEVRVLSANEEALVEAGPVSGPEHPLVDLLSTLRSSLASVEREKTNIASNLIEEEKYRTSLWMIKKCYINETEQCKCGVDVKLKATYEEAVLLKDKLPVARLKLESILKNVQESYCHHQHAALLAHFQIEELISETIQNNKNEIREALSLVLQALRLSEGVSETFSNALQRWAIALTAALLDSRDIRQLLFLIHHLFKQIRSVRWAAGLIRLHMGDSCEAARTIAVLDLLLTRSRLESGIECTEDNDETWEEVDRHGSGSAVSQDALRERDLLGLLYAFPLRDLVARIVLFVRADIKDTSDTSWGDRSGGRGVIKAACGVRALLCVCARACAVHAAYTRLCAALHQLASIATHALAGLHLHSKSFYAIDLEDRVTSELEASFALCHAIVGFDAVHRPPTTLLSDDSAHDYCLSLITSLHDEIPKRIESLRLETAGSACDERARAVAQAAIDRNADCRLAAVVLDFLVQTGLKQRTPPCKGPCARVARDWLPRFLHQHSYLYAHALHALAGIYQVEQLETTSLDSLAVHQWRPSPPEAYAVLDDWARRCPQVLQHLLLQLDYTPHSGISLECQLAIGAWLCRYVSSLPTEPPEWTWRTLRQLHVHRITWTLPLDAPPPEETENLFETAYSLLSSSWGHSIPLVCEYGAESLHRLALSRPRDAVHCLGLIMLVMSNSPESISHTPKFTEVFATLLDSGPTLMQRALGRGGEAGSTLLLRLVLQQLEHERCNGIPRPPIVTAWLHALWRITLPASALAILDTALLFCAQILQLDRYATMIMQESNYKEYIDHAIRNACVAPLLCERLLRACHGQRELNTQLNARLCDALARQRACGLKIHVDNALKQIGVNISSEELVINRTAAAILATPVSHPSHISLWRLFSSLYLQRSSFEGQKSSSAIGPLIFSGIIKSRTLNQLKKRLYEARTYHKSEQNSLKQNDKQTGSQSTKNLVEKSNSKVIENDLLPSLTMNDLTGNAIESFVSVMDSDSDEENEMSNITKERNANVSEYQDLLKHHLTAEELMRVCLLVLEEPEKYAVPSQNAFYDTSQTFETACRHASALSRPPADPEPPPAPTDAPASPTLSPLENVMVILMTLSNGRQKRSNAVTIKSAIIDINFKDTRALLDRVDNCLKDLKKLANEWSSEASRVAALDAQLWDLVGALRVSRSITPITKQCSNNCKPVTFVLPIKEWCISAGAEQGIRENRSRARAALQQLARARPHAARVATILHSIARRVQNEEVAVKMLDCVWRAAGTCYPCALAHSTISTLVHDLAERWVCCDGRLSAQLVSRWSLAASGGELALVGALVRPRRLPAVDRPLLYMALLRASKLLPSHIVFSYLSKFELSSWSQIGEASQRHEMLDALSEAVKLWGCNPDPEHHILIELIGVQSAALVSPRNLCTFVAGNVRAAAASTLPPAHLRHVIAAAQTHAHALTFDEIGHLLREMGVIWWEARAVSGKKGTARHAPYAPYVATLLHTLQRAFVAAAKKLSYEPQRVALYAWSSLCESWGPWVCPSSAAPPLLPCAGDDVQQFVAMLRHFTDNVHQVMIDCPGTEDHLLPQIFEWTIQTHLSVGNIRGIETSAHLSAMLAELAKLPWSEHQWFQARCLQPMMQICVGSEPELSSWVAECVRCVSASAWVRGVEAVHAPAHLASLLYLLTTAPVPSQTLKEASGLPWWLLPEVVLDQALDKFFADHYNDAQPYYSLPQFRLVLFASELVVHPSTPLEVVASCRARYKRASTVSMCVRTAAVPALQPHVRAHSTTILEVINALATVPNVSDEELEELLSRAAVILCVEPAAASALPVWEEWLPRAAPRVRSACVRAACAITVLQYFAPFSDAVARAHLTASESSGWLKIRDGWRASPWSNAGALVARGRLHAAYGLALAGDHIDQRQTFTALQSANINFAEEETIVSAWICAACRAARSADAEGAAAARALLGHWAEEPRLALLRVVTLQGTGNKPTAKHRLLCRLALCVLNPNSESAVRAYETCCTSVLSSDSDVLSWAKEPHAKRLPRLAIRLFPNHEVYFREEYNMAPTEPQ